MTIKAVWQLNFRSWIAKRIPPSHRITLNQRSIFIVPSRVGYSFLLIAFLVFLVAINYQNSLAYFVCFFMVGLFLVAMLHTWRNLAGLTLTHTGVQAVFAGQEVGFNISLKAAEGRSQYSISLSWSGSRAVTADPGSGSVGVTVYCTAKVRGRFRPGRLKVSSTFPVGLFHAWSWIDLNQEVVVYPEPDHCFSELPESSLVGEGDSAREVEGNEDFAGLRASRKTDSLTHISWKAFSKTGELYSRQFHGYEDKRCWLDFWSVPGQNLEEKLSRLCQQVLICHKQGIIFGLKLPDQHFELGAGDWHYHQCLEALALYQNPGGGQWQISQ